MSTIGMCGSYWIEQLWNPFNPDVPQKPFDMAVASQKFPEWDETLKRMPDLEDYLATYDAHASGEGRRRASTRAIW